MQPTMSKQPQKKQEVKNENQRISFKEKYEFESLEQQMPALQKEKVALENKMSTGTLDFQELQKTSERISTIIKLLDEKETRWLELSEKIN